MHYLYKYQIYFSKNYLVYRETTEKFFMGCQKTLPKNKGGMGLPDFKKYYFATRVSRVTDWHCHGNNTDWGNLEVSNNLQNVTYFPWTLNSIISKSLKQHTLIKTTLIQGIWEPISLLLVLYKTSWFPSKQPTQSFILSYHDSFRSDLLQ